MLRRIELARYGAFSGRSVELGPGLTVVVGPNESGKTTLRSAMSDLLWGLQPRLHPYSFVHAPSQLRVVAELAEHDDVVRTVTVDSRGCWEGDERIDPWWTSGSIRSREAWETALGLSLAGLREGTQAVVDGGGDLQQLVYRARTGVDLDAERARLVARADDLFKWRGGSKNVKVRAQAREVAARREAVAAATSSAADVVALRAAREDAASVFAGAVTALAEASTALEAAESDQRCLPVARELAEVRARLTALAELGPLLDPDSLVRHDSAVRELADLDDRLAAVASELDRLTARIDEADADPQLVALEAPVAALVKRESAAREAAGLLEAARFQVSSRTDELRRLLRLLDPAAAAVDDSALEAAASQVLLPADVVGRLDREAERVADAAERAEQARADADDAEVRRADLAGGVDARAAARLAAARTRRDDAWREVRDLWVAGVDLPSDGRAALAAALDAAHAELDTATDRAHDHAEATGRAGEADEQAALRLRAADEADSAFERTRAGWQDLLRTSGLPATLDPEAWDDRRATLDELVEALEALAAARRARDTAADVVASFVRDVTAVAGADVVEASDAWVALSGLHARVSASVKQRARQEAWETSLADQHDEQAALVARRDRVAALLEADGSDDLDFLLERSREHVALLEREAQLLERLAVAAGGGADLEALVHSLAGRDAADVEAARLAAEARAELATDAHAQAHTADALAAQELARAERVGSAASLRSEEQEAAEALAALVDEFLQTKVQIALLDRVLAADTGDGVPELLAHAERLAQRLTLGRVRRLVVDEVDGHRRLRVDADDLAHGSPAELSEGTADQVYLALRLAGIREQQAAARAGGAPALPVVLDDVLQAHDDVRTAAALEVLLDEARDQQIVLLTHHAAVADTAAALGAAVVRLAPLGVDLLSGEADGLETVSAPTAPTRRRRTVRAVPAAAQADEQAVLERALIEQQVLDTYLATHPDTQGAADDEAAAT